MTTSDFPEERYDLRILQSLRRIIRSVDIHSRSLSMKYDVTAPQLITLLALADYGPTTIAMLSQEIHLSPSTLVGIIDRLEAKKLVERERDTEDRRKIFIKVTKEGQKFADDAPSPLQGKLAQSLESLESAEQAVIARSLERVVELMEAKDIDAAPLLDGGEIQRIK